MRLQNEMENDHYRAKKKVEEQNNYEANSKREN